MLSEKESSALRDMLFHISAAERFAHGQTFESLRDDLMRLYAIIRSLEIISEASRRVSDELKARCRVRELHRSGDEAAWWRRLNIDPVKVALRLWQHTQTDGELPPSRMRGQVRPRCEPSCCSGRIN
jgi:hypothetical protein